MAETFFSSVNYPLSLLIQNIEAGEIALPGIQRPFVWTNAKVRDLFDSMYRGYPVGYLLFAPFDSWKAGATARAPRLLIVDGQQRLTSLYSVIKGTPVMREDFREEQIVLAFRPSDGKFAVVDSAVRRDPEFIPDISPLLAGKISHYRFVREFLERLRVLRPIDDEEEGRISSAIQRLYDLPSYSFTVLQLSRSLDEEQVAEIFVRINSRGVPLTSADFVLTLMAVSWEEGRRDLEQFCRRTRTKPDNAAPSPFNNLLHPTPDQMLRVVTGLGFGRVRPAAVYSILQGKDPETRQISEQRRGEQFKVLEEGQHYALDSRNWQDFLGTVRTAGFVAKEMISSETALLNCYTLFLIGKRDFGVEASVLGRVTAGWVTTVLLTGRYSGSAESAVEADLAKLREAREGGGFVEAVEKMIAAALPEQFWTIDLPKQLSTTSTRSAALLSYYAALNVLGATGLFSDSRVSEHFEGKVSLTRRQLFPRRYLARQGKKQEAEAAQAANYVLADRTAPMSGSPADYYSKLATGDSLPVAEMEHWHALPEGWFRMEFPTFLKARRKAMAGIIREAFARLC